MTARRAGELALGWLCYHLYIHILPHRLAFRPVGIALLIRAGVWAYSDESPSSHEPSEAEAPF